MSQLHSEQIGHSACTFPVVQGEVQLVVANESGAHSKHQVPHSSGHISKSLIQLVQLTMLMVLLLLSMVMVSRSSIKAIGPPS